MSAQKLRGGFYTPEPLVRFCLDRLRPLLREGDDLELLEPSGGDGAFIRGVDSDAGLARRVADLVAIEPLDLEAEKCRRSLAGSGIRGTVVNNSAIAWGIETGGRYDAAIGNPPFVRYQFTSAADKAAIPQLSDRAGVSFAGVSNLWIPVLVSALSRLKPGGAFSFVVPTELLTGLAASRLRDWVAKGFGDLRIDLFAPASFPDVLQEIAVFSGRRATSGSSTLTVAEHGRSGSERTWTHTVDPAQRNWTRYLLSPSQLHALDAALDTSSVAPLGSLARFQVSIVTGANDFFSVSDADREAFELMPWSRPLLPRIRHAPGLVYSAQDHGETLRSGARGWLLDFSAAAPDPLRRRAPARYLKAGEARELPRRYKCRIRQPWYRVPHIERGSLFLSKRSHRYPRTIVNEAGAYTTDTIYRGDPLPDSGISARALSAGFHSSLTLLSAELEGRSFGGGVLELVPSEIERLAVSVDPQAEARLDELDAIAREEDEEALVRATDAAQVAAGTLDRDLVETLSEARIELLERRLARNARAADEAGEDETERLAA